MSEATSNPDTTIKNFDYAVIRYKWIDLSGLNLDTKTQVISPYSDIKVGWGENLAYGEYLKWGGDNVNTGVESVLLNLKKLKEDNPTYTQEFKIALGGYWFNSRYSGDIILEFQTYLGGIMQQDGFDFINIGGTSVQLLKVAANITSDNRFDDPSTMVVKHLIHNRTTNSNRLEDA